MTATVHPLRTAQDPPARALPRSAGRAPTLRALGRAAAWVLAGALLAGAMIHAAAGEARALRAIPAEARSHLYARTLRNLESLCGAGSSMATSGFCQEQARVALALPECDERCARIARAALRTGTR